MLTLHHVSLRTAVHNNFTDTFILHRLHIELLNELNVALQIFDMIIYATHVASTCQWHFFLKDWIEARQTEFPEVCMLVNAGRTEECVLN